MVQTKVFLQCDKCAVRLTEIVLGFLNLSQGGKLDKASFDSYCLKKKKYVFIWLCNQTEQKFDYSCSCYKSPGRDLFYLLLNNQISHCQSQCY